MQKGVFYKTLGSVQHTGSKNEAEMLIFGILVIFLHQPTLPGGTAPLKGDINTKYLGPAYSI